MLNNNPFWISYYKHNFNSQSSQVAPTFATLRYCNRQKFEYESDAKTFGQM